MPSTQTFSSYAPLLYAMKDLPVVADTGLYFTGPGAAATFGLTAAGRALLDDASAAAQRSTLGLGTISTQAASAVAVTGGNLFGVTGQFTGQAVPPAGSGVEIWGGGAGTVQAYDRSGSSYIGLRIDALTIELRPSATTRATVNGNGVSVVGSVKPASYTVAGLPAAGTHGAGAIVFVSNESGGAVLAFSDGTNWRRVTDRGIVT